MSDIGQYPRFSADEMASRHAKVQKLIEENNLAAALVYGSGRFTSDVFWLTDWPGSREAYVLCQAGADPVVLLQLYNHIPMARRLSTVKDVRWAGANTATSLIELLKERKLDNARIGVIGSLPHQHYERLHEALPNADLIEVGGKLRMIRTIRSAEEIERIRHASQLTDMSMQAMADGLRTGMREDEIPYLIEPAYLKEGGYAGIHFVASMPMREPTICVPAQYQSDRVLQRGDCVITEISGAWWGYSGQIHRTYSLGEAPTKEWEDIHAVAQEAFETIYGLIKDGTSTREVEEAAELIHRRGYTIYDDLLHGTNQYPPIIQTKSTTRREGGEIIFRENMTITIQPNVITPDERMGLQFGETVLVKKNGCETFNNFPRRWIVCEA